MPDRFEQLFEEARNSGKVDEDWLDTFKSSFEASPLRVENKETRERAKAIAEQNQKYRDAILAAQFKEHGVTISPSALRIPDDLDPTDPEKVEGWLVQSGLASTKPTTDPAELATHDRIANAGSDPVPPGQLPNINNMTEEEFWAAHAAGLLTPKK